MTQNLMLKDDDLVTYSLRQGTVAINLDPKFMTINFLPEDKDEDVTMEDAFIAGNIIIPTNEESKNLLTQFMNKVKEGRKAIVTQAELVKMFADNIKESVVSSSLKSL